MDKCTACGAELTKVLHLGKEYQICIPCNERFKGLFNKEPKHITPRERELGRSEDYYQLTSQEQWEQDKKLGILDWDGK